MKKRRKNEYRRKCGGFTLVEILLVVAIIGMLAAVGIVSLIGRRGEAMTGIARGSIHSTSMAVEMYEMHTGRFPPDLKSLVTDDGAPNWKGPYVKGGVPKDPWGTELRLQVTGDRTYKVISAGKDLEFGTDDDLTSL